VRSIAREASAAPAAKFKWVHDMKMRLVQISFFVACICKYNRLTDISCYHKGALPCPTPFPTCLI